MNNILKNLEKENTNIFNLLIDIKDMKLEEYAKKIITINKTQNDFILENRIVIAEALEKSVNEYYNQNETSIIIEQFKRYPILQMADTCQLVYDIECLSNNFIYQLGMNQHGLKYFITQQCSTNKLLMYYSSLIGPGYTEIDSKKYKVFNISKKKMSKYSVCSCDNIEIVLTPTRNENTKPLPKDLSKYINREFTSPAKAFLTINNDIWNKLRMPNNVIGVFIDEDFSSDVLLGYINKKNKVIWNLIFNETHRNIFLYHIKKYINSDKCLFLRNTTDLFTYVHDNKLIDLYIDGNTLKNDIYNIEISIEESNIVYLLKNKLLYPNLILSYISINLLGLVTPLGGASQYEYLIEIQEILRNTLLDIKMVDLSTISEMTEKNISTMVSGILNKELSIFLNSNPLSGDIDFIKFENSIKDMEIKYLLDNYDYFDYFNILFERRKRRIENEK